MTASAIAYLGKAVRRLAAFIALGLLPAIVWRAPSRRPSVSVIWVISPQRSACSARWVVRYRSTVATHRHAPVWAATKPCAHIRHEPQIHFPSRPFSVRGQRCGSSAPKGQLQGPRQWSCRAVPQINRARRRVVPDPLPHLLPLVRGPSPWDASSSVSVPVTAASAPIATDVDACAERLALARNNHRPLHDQPPRFRQRYSRRSCLGQRIHFVGAGSRRNMGDVVVIVTETRLIRILLEFLA